MAAKERPILFTAPMVRAILDGKKTQTRRVVKFPKWMDAADYTEAVEAMNRSESKVIGLRGPCDGYKGKWKSRYGAPGDLLWVKETWQAWTEFDNVKPDAIPQKARERINYVANENVWDAELRPSLFMPRWASRITLRITSVRIERVQDISGKNCMAEGVKHPLDGRGEYPSIDIGIEHETAILRRRYAELWDRINGGKDGADWKSNPFVWVVGFERVTEAA